MSRYSINKRDCNCSITKFYEKAAKKAGLNTTDTTTYDCRKICITEQIRKALFRYYSNLGLSDEKIAMLFLQYGPKASLDGDKYEFEIEEGFAFEMEAICNE